MFFDESLIMYNSVGCCQTHIIAENMEMKEENEPKNHNSLRKELFLEIITENYHTISYIIAYMTI